MRGGEEDSNTRSSLMWESVRIIKKLKPRFVIWENVKNSIGGKNKANFDKYIKQMEILGYKSKYKILNSQDFGIPTKQE